MNPAPELFQFLARAEVVAEIHGVPVETVIFHGLALASTVAGDLVFFRPPDRTEQIRAKLSVLIVTGDATMPWWAHSAVEGVLADQDAVLAHKDQKKSADQVATELEEQKRVMSALGHGSMELFGRSVPDLELLKISERIRLVRNLARYRHLHRIGGRKPCPAPVDGYTCALAAEGEGDYMKLLRGRDWGDVSPVLSQSPGSGHSNIVGWISERDLERVAKSAGLDRFARFGWIVGAPPFNNPTDPAAKKTVPVDGLLKNFKVLRLAAVPFEFNPHPVGRDFLDLTVEEIRRIMSPLPAKQISQAIPDQLLPWRLAALLFVMAGSSPRPNVTEILCCRLGAYFALRVMRYHIHRLRRLFPADDHGDFTGLDAAILRALTNAPQTVRSIQRRLRETSKTRCLVTLHRACDAGLAHCVGSERFALPAMPLSGPGMSEFLSEIDAETKFNSGCDKNPADSADRPAPAA